MKIVKKRKKKILTLVCQFTIYCNVIPGWDQAWTMTEVDRTEKKMEGNKVNYNDRRKNLVEETFEKEKLFAEKNW